MCGSRTFDDQQTVEAVLDGIFHQWADLDLDEPFTIITGGATGADELAKRWWRVGVDAGSVEVSADWRKHGKAAGPIRNQQMLDDEQPDVVWAFVDKPLSESRGTADMVRRASAAGVPTFVVERVARGGES